MAEARVPDRFHRFLKSYFRAHYSQDMFVNLSYSCAASIASMSFPRGVDQRDRTCGIACDCGEF